MMDNVIGRLGVLADHRLLTRFDGKCGWQKGDEFRGGGVDLTPGDLFQTGKKYIDPMELMPMGVTFVTRREI